MRASSIVYHFVDHDAALENLTAGANCGSPLATIGGRQREHSVGSSGVIHEERSFWTDVVLFVLVQRVGRPGAFRLVLIRRQPCEALFQFCILR